MPEKFVVTIPIKYYVKRFIELNYGLPADFSNNPDIQKELRRCLRKPDVRWDYKFNDTMCGYTEKLEILISQDDFYRYGWEFSKTDVINFGKMFEMIIKRRMREIVKIYCEVGGSIRDSIRKFQTEFSMEEEYWPYESIKKEYFRHRPDYSLSIMDELSKKINTLFLENVSPKKDRISKAKQNYETAE